MIQGDDIIRMAIRQIRIRLLALCNSRARAVSRVEVPEDEALVAHSRRLSDEIVVIPVRWAHPRGRDADDARERELYLPHLVMDLVPAKRGEVKVRPGVRCDEVSRSVSVLQGGDLAVIVDTVPYEGCILMTGAVVKCTGRTVIAVYKECAFNTSRCESVRDVWAENKMNNSVRIVVRALLNATYSAHRRRDRRQTSGQPVHKL